jgi:ubiquinone/menaquinone biosynthesis C-methylase UbiE
MDILGIAPGETVADIGVGSGWFTVRAAKRVRDTGTVYPVDINPEAIRYIESRIRKENLRNVKPILGRPDIGKRRPARSGVPMAPVWRRAT